MTSLIIEAALNGGTPKHRNPSVPRSTGEVAEDGLRCIEAGAAIVHNHNDEPVVGGANGVHAAAPYVEAWTQILTERPDAILYPTMASGGPGTNIAERYAHIPALADAGVLRIGLVDPGSVNVGPAGANGLPVAVDATYLNTFADAHHMFAVCRQRQLAPSISIFEPGFLRVALRFHGAGMMAPGALIKLYFGGPTATFGLPPTLAGLEAYLDMLGDSGLPWSVAVLGGDVVASGLAALAIERGGHVRVGLEDYAGPRTPTNVELVGELATLGASLGRPAASASEAAEILGMPTREDSKREG
ncbi:MAG: 3-keto-5-aminohexanoate cleavage protein [Anaerolineaceae bacterium]